LRVKILDERMTRSVIFEAPDVEQAYQVASNCALRIDDMQQAIAKRSRYTKLIDIHHEIVGKLLYLRFEFTTGNASGHNMVTQAADDLMVWFVREYPQLQYVSISGNYCIDKKASAVNGILGRGKSVVAEMLIPHDICKSVLKTTAKAVADLNTKKNLIGSILAGSIRSANAHYANMLLALYLATGQDAANIVEGSQGITYAEATDAGLYFSVNIPNIIVGCVGNGKHLDFVKENLALLGCDKPSDNSENARRLAAAAAATVFCSELSLMAAQTNPGELMRAHDDFERIKKTNATTEDAVA
jgi:hydroxymethylglutaryl-CoA reductase (NADPH)